LNSKFTTVNDNYTKEEWELVSALPQMVGAAMAGAGSSGLVGSTKEMMASVRNMTGAKEKYGSNEFVASLLPNLEDRQKAMEDAKANRERIMARIKEREVKSREGLADMILDDSRKAMWIVKQKETEENASEYKRWILESAMNIANAAKEGDFLGFGGEKFSEKEKALYSKLEEALS